MRLAVKALLQQGVLLKRANGRLYINPAVTETSSAPHNEKPAAVPLAERLTDEILRLSLRRRIS